MNMRTMLLRFCLAALVAIGTSNTLVGYQQQPLTQQLRITDSDNSIQLIEGSTQSLKFPYDVPELLVENPEVISASGISPNEILIRGVKPGISSITVSDPSKNLQVITVEVTMDVRKLERAFANLFPDSNIKVAPLKTGVILTGHVARADQVENVMKVAQDYFPTNVINELQVSGSQNISINVKVYEVSRTKLREAGIDWSFLGSDISVVSSVSELIQSVAAAGSATADGTLSLGVFDGTSQFNAVIQLLEKRQLAKLLDEPTLTAQNGRPAEFLSGGEIPIQVAAGLGNNAIEFRPFGTKLDLVPIVHGQGQLTLEIRAEVSEIAPDLSGNSNVPGFRVRRVNTGVKMNAGHTLALAGDYREDVNTEVVGIPGLMDNPVFGRLFRRNREEKNETELVFLITPRFISEVEANRLPRLGPGQITQSPSDVEFYRNAHVEVPRCKDDCPVDDRFSSGGPQYHNIQDTMPIFQQPAGGQQGVPGQQVVPGTVQEVPPAFGSSFRLPGRKQSQPQARQASGGFLWPTKTR